MTKVTNTGTYKVKFIAKSFFAVFEFNDGEVLFLSKPYRTVNGATKRLLSHINQSN
jgi:hypothetical protein